MHYTEFGEGASWVPTIYQDTWAWAAETLPMDNLCPFLALPGFCVETIRLCSMHNVNLGILQVCNGSALISLVEAVLYGDPNDSLSLNLRRAFRDFETWRKVHKLQCSQAPWTTGLVVKKNGNIVMTHKAYNGRIIVAYFAECCDLVVSKNLPGDSRLFGQWLAQQVIQGKRDWPTDSEFGQLQPI